MALNHMDIIRKKILGEGKSSALAKAFPFSWLFGVLRLKCQREE